MFGTPKLKQPSFGSATPNASFSFGSNPNANTASGQTKFTFSLPSPSTSTFGQPTNTTLLPLTPAQSTSLSENAATTFGTSTSTLGGLGKTGKAILPSIILENQICSECWNYLSIGPVMVNEGKKICGRCVKSRSTGKVCRSLYNKIAECGVFKCVNHYSGCREVFAYNEAVDHEKTCKKADLKCPYCEFTGNGCQLVHHFTEKHPKSVAKDNAFPVLLEPGSCSFIFAEDDDLLYLTISITDKSISISNLLAAYEGTSCVKYFKIIFFNPNSRVQYVTPVIQANTNRGLYDQQGNSFQLIKEAVVSCFPTGQCLVEVKFLCCDREMTKYVQESATTHNGQFSQKTEFMFDRMSKMKAAELHQFVLTEWNKLQKCVNCALFLIDKNNIYFCRKHHLACEACSSKKCPQCSAFTQWNKVTFAFLSVQCDWEGCDKEVSIFEFLVHKQICPHRQYQCPGDNCRYAACLENFKKHWHLTPYQSSAEIKVGDNCAFYCFVPFCNEFIHITAEITSDKITVNLNEEGVVLRDAYDLQLFYKPQNKDPPHSNLFGSSMSNGNANNSSQHIKYKWAYSQLELARTLTAQNTTKGGLGYFYVKFLQKVDYPVDCNVYNGPF